MRHQMPGWVKMPGCHDDNPVEETVPAQPPEPELPSTRRYNTRGGERKDYKSMHSGRTTREPQRHYGLHISVNKALNRLGRTALRAIVDEMLRLMTKQTDSP